MGSKLQDVAIVVVTYRRQDLLSRLLESILLLDLAPAHVFVVDNESSAATRDLVLTYARIAEEGLTAVPWSCVDTRKGEGGEGGGVCGDGAACGSGACGDGPGVGACGIGGAACAEGPELFARSANSPSSSAAGAFVLSPGGAYTCGSFTYLPQKENLGGAGGFCVGVEAAYKAGAKWFWLMDDDVEVAPDALSKLAKWTGRFDCIQGSRLDFDGGPFYWQYRFDERLGVYDMFATRDFGAYGFKPANAICFEGGLFSREVVDEIGLPDARFFLYWDDCIYGYLASKHFECAAVSDVILRRTRDIPNIQAAAGRQLNSSSDLTRYHLMKNRGHMAQYMKREGDYCGPVFLAGTLLCAAKELVRLMCVDRKNLASGTRALMRGAVDGHKIANDPTWKPYSEVKHA